MPSQLSLELLLFIFSQAPVCQPLESGGHRAWSPTVPYVDIHPFSILPFIELGVSMSGNISVSGETGQFFQGICLLSPMESGGKSAILLHGCGKG